MDKLKKYLPLILLLVGVLIIGGVFLFVRSRREKPTEVGEDDSALIDVPLDKRPVVSLVPTEDGHYLTLRVEKIVVDEFDSLDYLLLYQTKDEVTQGVPGSEKVADADAFEAKLLMGSESSGKFRYDEGVETGSVELKFRNDEGKLVAKFDTDFHIQKGAEELTSVDGNFSKVFESLPENIFFVTMHTIGESDSLRAFYTDNGYAIFASDESLTPDNL